MANPQFSESLMAPLPFGTSKKPYTMNTNAITPGQKRKISDLCKQKGVTKKDMQKLLETGLLAKLLEGIAKVDEPKVLKNLPTHLELLMKAAMFDSLPNEWEFSNTLCLHTKCLSTFDDFIVDYSKSFAELLRENGFDRINARDVTEERFPIKGEGTQRLEGFLVPITTTQTVARALKGINARGLRPGNTAELLSLPSRIKVEINKGHINFLGSDGITVTALGTMDRVGVPNGNRRFLTMGYIWRKEYSSLSSGGGQYVSGYSSHYLLAFSK